MHREFNLNLSGSSSNVAYPCETLSSNVLHQKLLGNGDNSCTLNSLIKYVVRMMTNTDNVESSLLTSIY